LDKSRDSELQNDISYTAVEEQWESNSALKFDQLNNPTVEKMAFEYLELLLEIASLSTPFQHCSHPLKP
jgi:hypothetical protein